ncbi:MAG: RluA family pseudouridine synthase [Pyrinomonadaceae bacterium]|nr:RluA family pseudouridine synthase [Pyrinomonadaceae bacterium]
MEERLIIVVPERAYRFRLEDYLLDHFPNLSKMYLRDAVKTGRCEVNGRHENIGHRLKPNDLIEIVLDPDRETAMRPENIELDIVHEDDDIIVVNKPEGMLVHPSHRENSGTLLNALAYWLNKDQLTQSRKGAKTQRIFDVPESSIVDPRTAIVRPGLIHRLDKQTSGLIVVAKNARAHRILCNHFMKKRVEKRYLALVDGIVERDEGTIEAPIGRYAELKYWSVKEDGKHSESQFWVRERYADTTLLELEPVTGRTNQLRIHCELIGHPIVGDTLRKGRAFERLCLHAYEIGFPHPTTGEKVVFVAEMPLEFGTGTASEIAASR